MRAGPCARPVLFRPKRTLIKGPLTEGQRFIAFLLLTTENPATTAFCRLPLPKEDFR